jgi:hypothetical protein
MLYEQNSPKNQRSFGPKLFQGIGSRSFMSLKNIGWIWDRVSGTFFAISVCTIFSDETSRDLKFREATSWYISPLGARVKSF